MNTFLSREASLGAVGRPKAARGCQSRCEGRLRVMVKAAASIAVISALLLGGGRAEAAAWTWDGGGANTLWTTGTNWAPNTAPTAGNGTDIYFNAAGAARLSNAIGTDFSLRQLIFDSNATSNVSISLADSVGGATGRTLTFLRTNTTSLSGQLQVNAAASGTFTVGAGTVGGISLDFMLGMNIQNDSTNATLIIGRPMAETANFAGRTVTKAGVGTLVLSAANTYTGTTSISAGTLQIGAGSTTGSINSSSVLSVASGAVLANNRSDTTTISNRIVGTGTVRNLSGAGEFYLSGSNSFSGTLQADRKMGASGLDSLDGVPSVNVSAGASFSIGAPFVGGTATINSLTGSGLVDPVAGATAGTRTLSVQSGTFSGLMTDGSGSRVLALTKNGAGTLQLSGANTYTGPTAVNAGILALGASDRLSDSTAVTVAGGGLNMSTFGDTVSSLTITSGSVFGSGTLTASTYALQGGNVVANLGAGTLTASVGSTTLTGSSAATTVNVNSGTLALAAADRFVDTAAVTVAGGGLNMSTFGDTVSSLTITSGSVFGSGTLTASTYGLGGGTIAANLGGGTLNVTANSTLSGAAAATNVNLNAGTLTLSSGGRLAAAAAVSGSSGASLALGGNETIGSLSGAAGVSLGGYTLTVGGNNANSAYSGSLSGVGVFAKVGSGTFTFTGSIPNGVATSVSAGRFVANGMVGTGSLSVAAAAWLAGTGTIGGPVAVDGTLSPGNSPGLLTLGSLTLGNASTTLMEIAGTTRGSLYDSIDITGGGIAFDGTLTLDFQNTFADNTSFLLFGISTGTGSRTGSFANVTAIGSYGSLTFTNNGSGVWSSGPTGISNQEIRFTQSTGEVIVVPEPTTVGAVGAAVGISCLVRRRRR